MESFYAVWSKLRIFCKAMRSTFTVFTSAIEESIKGYATWKLWCGWAAIKGGDRPTRLLPHTKKLLVPIRFFPLLGRLCSGRFYISLSKCDFRSLFHAERWVHISIYCGFYLWSAGFSLWCKSIFFDLFWSVKLFIVVEQGFLFSAKCFMDLNN